MILLKYEFCFVDFYREKKRKQRWSSNNKTVHSDGATDWYTRVARLAKRRKKSTSDFDPRFSSAHARDKRICAFFSPQFFILYVVRLVVSVWTRVSEENKKKLP